MSEVKDRGRPRVEVTREPPLYGDGSQYDPIVDEYRQQLGDGAAGERRAAWARENRTNPNRTPSQGGNFAPPGYDQKDTATFPRFTRQVADAVINRPLPAGVQSINVPRITTGTATAATIDNTATPDVDLADSEIACPVITVTGAQVVAQQLLDQSPATASLTSIVTADLEADYNAKLEAQLLNGTGSAGQLLGLLNTSGINAVTFTNASPSAILLYPSLGQMVAKVAQARGTAAGGVFVLSSSRAAWLASSEDSSLRPLALSNAPQTGGLDLVSYWTVRSDAMPRTINGTQEPIVFFRPLDCILWESEPTIQVAVEPLSGTLGARITYRRYAAFACRYPSSVAALTGSGTIPVAPF